MSLTGEVHMRSLSAILSRSSSHEALVELLNCGDDVEALKVTLAKIWRRLEDGDGPLDEAACDELLKMAGKAFALTFRLNRAFEGLDQGGPSRPKLVSTVPSKH
jgi:hypothetical protein